MKPFLYKEIRRGHAVLLAVLVTVLAASPLQAQDQLLTEIRNVYPEELRTDGFILEEAQDVFVEAIGPAGGQDVAEMGDAWILNARTREVVWTLGTARTEERSRFVREAAEKLSLPAGAYEVYFASYPTWGGGDRWDNTNNLGDVIRNVMDEIFDRGGRSDLEDVYRRNKDEFHLTVHGTRKGYRESAADRLAAGFRDQAIVSLSGLGSGERVQQGFMLKRPMEIDVYAIGELRRDEAYDYAWILNADTRARVWTMEYRNTEHAGGNEKNRVANEILQLPEGRYVAFFVTDDSHAYRDWNTGPPYDPAFWGLTLLPVDPEMRRFATTFDYESGPPGSAIVTLRSLGDDAYRAEGFTLKQPLDLRIYALGEGSGGRMHDYGWITDADTHRRVWVMDYDETDHAGGTRKNRQFDGVVHLPAGNYVAHFITDDSHSFEDFNAAPPDEPEAWGLTIAPARPDTFRPEQVAPYNPMDAAGVLAQITRVRDDARERARFTLRKEARVRIYALGEGSGGDMYDYAWIEDEDGDTVWKMTYRNTDHAGGGEKNREVNTVITLPAGDYTVFYRSDDSHSFEEFNTAPPYDPAAWGITIRRD